MKMQRSILSFAVVAMMLNVAAATNYTVGAPGGGWDQSTDLRAWASSITFLVGDTLIFSYTPNHDVVEVSEGDYPTCQLSNPIGTYTGGNTVIPLTAPGKRFFVCGTAGHCDSGMKVEIDVLAATSPPPSSPPTPTSPTPSSPPTTPSTSPVPSPSPRTSSPAPANSPDNTPQSPPSPGSNTPASSPTSSPPPTSSAVPPPSPSSANKESVKANLAMGFGLVVMMVLTL